MTVRGSYTLVCKTCQKIIYRTRNPKVERPVRYGLCARHTPTRWNHRNVPLSETRCA